MGSASEKSREANSFAACYVQLAMSAIRLPLLCAFAGGCLSSAVLFGMWQTAGGSSASAAKQQQRAPRVVQRMTPSTVAPSAAPSSEAIAYDAVAREQRATAPAAPQEADGALPTPAGSPVADVLMQLEAAYRERATAQATASATSATAPAQIAGATPGPTPGVPARPEAEVVSAGPAVTAAAALAARPVVPAQPAAPIAVAIAPPVSTAPVVVAQYTPPPTQVHYGDVNQNTYITNVRQGDMYQMQMQMQMQQIAMLQYIQLLGMSSALAGPVRNVGVAVAPQRGTLNTGITNPDNPWGFHFSPPNLVR